MIDCLKDLKPWSSVKGQRFYVIPEDDFLELISDIEKLRGNELPSFRPEVSE